MRVCHFCDAALEETLQVFRSSTCASCSRDLKICLNCRFYNEGAHWECLESIPEPVADKERGNFCDYFRYRQSVGGRQAGGRSAESHSKAKADFGKLFGD